MMMNLQLVSELFHRSIPTQFGRSWRQIVGTWSERRRQRMALAELDDRLLSDIGVTRREAARESAKPFWRL